MKFTAATALMLTLASAWIVPPPLSAEATLPACGVDSPHPCACPSGTIHVWMQTFFSWGASAWSVRNLTGNFSDLSWVPQEIKSTVGPDNTVGSFRTTEVALDVGVFDWLEEITEYTTQDDGSFSWAFELKNVPMDFQTMPGRFEGEWERFEARANGEHQTDVYWTLSGCHSGGTHSFPVFQMYCHNHVNQTLSEMGVLKGTTSEPFSEIQIGNREAAFGGGKSSFEEMQSFKESQQFVMARKGQVDL